MGVATVVTVSRVVALALGLLSALYVAPGARRALRRRMVAGFVGLFVAIVSISAVLGSSRRARGHINNGVETTHSNASNEPIRALLTKVSRLTERVARNEVAISAEKEARRQAIDETRAQSAAIAADQREKERKQDELSAAGLPAGLVAIVLGAIPDWLAAIPGAIGLPAVAGMVFPALGIITGLITVLSGVRKKGNRRGRSDGTSNGPN